VFYKCKKFAIVFGWILPFLFVSRTESLV
jgi:hypothetical protein